MEKRKFYYDKDTKVIENRPFLDDYQEQNKPFIELTFKEWEKYLSSCNWGYKKAYINNEIIEIPDIEIMNSVEYKNAIKEEKITELKQYLSDTDYVITKLNEAKIEDDDLFNSLKLQYADTLAKRKEARLEINELENN